MRDKTIIISKEQSGSRLDALLASQQDLNISRSYIQDLIQNAQITINQNKTKCSYKVKAGDEVAIKIPEDVEINIEAENIPLDILYEDSELMVINKPINMVVHPAPGSYNGTLVNALLYHAQNHNFAFECQAEDEEINTKGMSIKGKIRPGIVHRLDKDTSGLMLVAKTDLAFRGLSEQIQNRSIERRYQALVQGNLKSEKGIVEKPIMRNPKDREKMCVASGETRAKYAKTNYQVLERCKLHSQNFCLLECKLETGRTHQIRVHLASIGNPILGDLLYGASKKNPIKAHRPMLHSWKLGFTHPKTKENLSFCKDPPDDFQEVLAKLGL